MATTNSVVKAFLLGSILSAVVTAFVTPKSGKELRDKTKQQLSKASHKASDKAEELKHKYEEGKELAKDKMARIKDSGVLVVKETKRQINKNKNEGLSEGSS
jgi:gas vesicle protein